MPEETDLDFLTLREAADICKFKGTEAIRRAIDRQELPAYKLRHRHIVIPRVAVVRWLLGQRMHSNHVKQKGKQ